MLATIYSRAILATTRKRTAKIRTTIRARRQFESSIRWAQTAFGSEELRHGARWLLYCIAVGLVAGLGALLFDLLCNVSTHVFLERLAGWSPARPAGETSLFEFTSGHRSLVLLALAPAIGGLLCGILVGALAPEASGHGTDSAIEAYHRHGGRIRPTVPIVKIIASAITLGAGGSGGREGPIAQTGAGFGSYIATRLRLSSDDRRILMAAGVGAGIGSIFRAPLAGALFASEILYRSPEFEASVMIPACVASIIAYCTFTIVHGTDTLFHTPALAFSNPLELVAYFVLAVVLAVYGFVYVRAFYGVHGLFEQWRIPGFLKPAIGGLITGLIGVGLLLILRREESLSVLSFGYGVIQKALEAPETLSIGAGLLAVIALGKIATTSFSIGSGGSGGVFGPSMVIGACAGGGVGLVLHHLFPDVVRQPAAYVVVGMAGFFSGIAKTPISTLVMVSEMTGSYSLLLPTMWVCVLTFVMSQRWNLYSKQVDSRIDSPAHQGRFAVNVLHGIGVMEVIEPRARVQSIFELDPMTTVLSVIGASEQTALPVLDEKGGVIGLISLDQVRRLFTEGVPHDTVRARDLMVSDFPWLSPSNDLSEALKAFAAVQLDEIPVCDPSSRVLLGLLSRRSLTRTYVERMAELGGGAKTATH